MTVNQWTATWVADAVGAINAVDWYLTLHLAIDEDPNVTNELSGYGRHGPTVFSTSGGTVTLNETVTWTAVSSDVTHVGVSDTATEGAGEIRGWIVKPVVSGDNAVLVPGDVQFSVDPEAAT